MSYTPPVDPTPGSPIRANDVITYHNENIRYFYSGRAIDALLYSQSADMQYTSTSWGLYHANLTKSVTIQGTRVLVRCSFMPKLFAGGAGTQWGFFDLAMDGVRYASGVPAIANGLAAISNLHGNGDALMIEALFTNVTPGLRAFTLHGKYKAGTATAGGITILGSSSGDSQPVHMVIHEY